jgi:hypothetical protein
MLVGQEVLVADMEEETKYLWEQLQTELLDKETMVEPDHTLQVAAVVAEGM